MLDVCLLGCGGMMPLPYRWLTALLTRFNGSSLLIDCGEGTQIAIKEKGWSFKPIDVICFTHYHGDHISGLPGLLLTMGNADRREPLTLIGPKGLERVVNALRVIAPELPFPIIYKEIEGAEQVFEMKWESAEGISCQSQCTLLWVYIGDSTGQGSSTRSVPGKKESANVLETFAKGRDC